MAQLANTNSVTHGASSGARTGPVARAHRRRVLRLIGLRTGDLNPLGRGYLDLYVRALAKVELLDAYFAEHGLLAADGEPQPATKIYFVAANSARLALARLEEHLRVRVDYEPLRLLEATGREVRERAEANGS